MCDAVPRHHSIRSPLLSSQHPLSSAVLGITASALLCCLFHHSIRSPLLSFPFRFEPPSDTFSFVKPNTRDRKGLIPLQHTIRAGFHDGFSILMKRCQNPLGLIDREGNTILHLSVLHPHSVEIVRDIMKIKGHFVPIPCCRARHFMSVSTCFDSTLFPHAQSHAVGCL
jgi:hypothetical protein